MEGYSNDILKIKIYKIWKLKKFLGEGNVFFELVNNRSILVKNIWLCKI